MSIPDLSPSLKSFRKFFVQAKQVEKVDPKVAWLLRTYAVQTCFKKPEATQQDKMALLSVLDQLEASRSCSGMSPEERSDHLLDFALNVFLVGDNQDRAGEATQSTAKCFLSCATFFEAMRLFGELDPDIEEKRKYCLWKAADIVKALREGRAPTPGGFGDTESNSELQDAFGMNDPISASSQSNLESSQKYAQPSAPADDPWATFTREKEPNSFLSTSTPVSMSSSSHIPDSSSGSQPPLASSPTLNPSPLGPPPAFAFDDFPQDENSGSRAYISEDSLDTFAQSSSQSGLPSFSEATAPPAPSPSVSEQEAHARARAQAQAEAKAMLEAQEKAEAMEKIRKAQLAQAKAEADAKANAQAQAALEAKARAEAEVAEAAARASALRASTSSTAHSDDPWADFYAKSGKPNPEEVRKSNASKGTGAYSGDSNSITIQADRTSAKDRYQAVAEATRLARHVISALSFDDTPTAVDKLSKALALLIPYKDQASEYM